MQTIYLTDDTIQTSPQCGTTSGPGVVVRWCCRKRVHAPAEATLRVAWLHKLCGGLQLLSVLCCLGGLALAVYGIVFFERFQSRITRWSRTLFR